MFERQDRSPVSFHILRHSYASLLTKAGVPLQVVASALGHADARMTEKHYGHLAPSHLAQLVRANPPTLSDAPPRKPRKVARLRGSGDPSACVELLSDSCE